MSQADNLSVEALQKRIAELTDENNELKKQKKFGLVWEDKPDAQVLRVRDEAPMLREDTSKAVVTDQNATNHILINGDNFHALTALRATHTGRVDVIYIDPPYNTGNKDFIYNDNYLDKEDGYRHSKWLSFMEKRLVLARELMADTGVVVVSIDDNEQARLQLLMDEVFGPENFMSNIIWQGGRKNDSRFVSVGHDYFLIYVKNKDSLQGKWRAEKPEVDEMVAKAAEIYEEELRQESKTNTVLDQLVRLYDAHESPISTITYDGYDTKPSLQVWVSEFILNRSNEWWSSNFGPVASRSTKKFKKWISSVSNDSPVKNSKHYNNIDEKGRAFFPSDISWPGGGGPRYEVMHPITKNPVPVPSRGWIYSQSRMEAEIIAGNILFKENDSLGVNRKSYLEEVSNTVLDSVFYQDRRASNKFLQSILGSGKFDFPKDHEILAKWINYVSQSKRDALILDFFAGSGSTAHAVAQLNSKDGGHRQCVLVTDGGKTELTGESSKNTKEGAINIAEEITYERVRRVLTGKDWADGKDHEALGGNLRYFKVEMEPTPHGTTESDQRLALEKYTLDHATIAANIFNEVLSKNEFDEETGMTVDYKVYADDIQSRYLVGVNAHDYALTDLEEWFNGLSAEASVVMVGNGLEEIEWVRKNSDRITVDDVLGRVIRSRKYVASKLPLV